MSESAKKKALKTMTLPNQMTLPQWVELLRSLRSDVSSWAKRSDWQVAVEPNQITEERLGTYSADILRIRTPKGEVRLEPVGMAVLGAEGRVDLTAWPSMNRMKLIRKKGQWEVLTDSNVPWPKSWSMSTFTDLAT